MQNCADCYNWNSVIAQSRRRSFSIVMPVTGIEYLLYCYTMQINFLCHSDYHSFKYKQGDQGNLPSSAVKYQTLKSLCSIQYSSAFVYRTLPKVTTLVTFGISSIWGSLFSGGGYFRGVVLLTFAIEDWRTKKRFVHMVLLSIFLTK